jgi:Acetyltransferase (GNAT) domain
MLVRSITPLASSRSVPDWWTPLFEVASSPSIFLSSEWLQTWLEVYGDEFDGHWIRWEEGGVVVGGCLFILRTMSKALVGIRSGFINATGDASVRTPFAEFNDVLFIAHYAQAIASDLSRFLAERPWDRLVLSGYEKGGVIDMLVPMLPSTTVETQMQVASYVGLDTLHTTTLEQVVSPNTRSQIRRARRTYEVERGPITLKRAQTLDEGSLFLDELANLHNARRVSKGEQGSFESEHVRTFHKLLISRLWPKSQVDILLLSAGSMDIGYLYNFVYRGKVYFFQSGFVFEENAAMKPGLLMHSTAIEKYRDEGFKEYDFLAGDAQYKRSLAKLSRTLYWSVIYRDSWKMRLLLVVRRAVHHLRAM